MSYLLLSLSSQPSELGYIGIIPQTSPLSNPGITSPHTPGEYQGQFRFLKKTVLIQLFTGKHLNTSNPIIKKQQ
jgi:hypothetical protein